MDLEYSLQDFFYLKERVIRKLFYEAEIVFERMVKIARKNNFSFN